MIGPGPISVSLSTGVGQVPGHRSALGADGLQGASAQVDGCLAAAMNMQTKGQYMFAAASHGLTGNPSCMVSVRIGMMQCSVRIGMMQC